MTNFQCIVQIICQEQGIYKNNITYFGQRLPWNQIELKYFNDTKAINFNSSSYFRPSDSYPILYLFHSPSNSVVKVKVTHFIYTGRPDIKCSFGGATVLEQHKKTFTELHNFCNKYLIKNHIKWPIPRNIYSSTSVSMLVLYAYNTYSDLTTKILVSYSLCKVIILKSPCEKLLLQNHKLLDEWTSSHMIHSTKMEIININPEICTVLQLSSGMYRSFPQGTNNIYQLLLEKEGFPSCELSIRINLSSFKNLKAYSQCI